MVRFALSVTIVEMVNVNPSNTLNNTNGTCSNNSADFVDFNNFQIESDYNVIKVGKIIGKKYNWTEDQICQIEAAFFYGFAIGNLFFGLASDILGSKYIIGNNS